MQTTSTPLGLSLNHCTLFKLSLEFTTYRQLSYDILNTSIKWWYIRALDKNILVVFENFFKVQLCWEIYSGGEG